MKAIVGFAAFFIALSPAFAAPDFADQGGIVSGFNNFVAQVHALTRTAITSGGFTSMVEVMWRFFAITLLIWTMYKYVFKGADFLEVLTAALLIMMVRVLMETYDTLTNAIWEAGIGFATALQTPMLGTGDLFFAPAFLTRLVQSLVFPPIPLLDIGAAIALALNLVVIGIAMLLLSMMAYVVAIWGFWGFTLAKLIGLIFVPFIMYERLAFLFDGWLRFFFGFIIYYIIARLNLALVAVAIALYFGVPMPPSVTAIGPTEIPSISQLSETIGLLTFALVGIVALFSTGRFASTVVSGAGGGGVGLAAYSAARSVAGLAMGRK